MPPPGAALRLTASPVANVESEPSTTTSPPRSRSSLQLELVHRRAHREGGTGRPLRVVLVGLWNAERSHDRISGELLHDAPVLDDARRNHLEERVDTTAHDLGVGCLHQTSGIDDVDEQDSRELAFHD